MAMISVKNRQLGTSLVELLIASASGFIVLMLVGSVYINGQELHAKRSQKLYLIQSLNDAFRFIKDDIYRAGYNGKENLSAILSGANSVIHVDDSKNNISYVYKIGEKPSVWRAVSIKYLSDNIKICSKSDLVYIPEIGFCQRYYSLLNDEKIEITNFDIKYTPVDNLIRTGYLTIFTNAKLKNTQAEYSLKIKLMQRNW